MGGDGPLHDGQTVAVQRHHGELVLLNGKELAGVGGLFVVLAHGVKGLVDHVPQRAGLDGQSAVRAGVGQIGIIRRAHGQDVELGHTALDGGVAAVAGGDGHFAHRQPAHHVAQQLCREDDLARLPHVGLDGGGDGHFQVVAGEGELEAVRFQEDTFQCRDGRAKGHRPADAVDGGGQKGFVADDVHLLRSFLSKREKGVL